jgi:sigma-B regulation protein RsbU (phosphoserine phosphatase)
MTTLLQGPTLACMEVWGGNGAVTRRLELPGLDVWIYSSPAESGAGGGDIHYLSVCSRSMLSRVVLADVSGHGAHANKTAQALHALMRRYVDTWDQAAFVSELNEEFRGLASEGAYATALVLGLLRDSGDVVYTNAGHLPPALRRSMTGAWEFLPDQTDADPNGPSGLPVGMIAGTRYCQSVFRLGSGDVLVLYTDGITEASDRDGEMAGSAGLLEWLSGAVADSPEAIGREILRRLSSFRNDNAIDDETVVVIRKVER